MIEFQTIVFYCFAAVMLAAGLGVILVSNPVYAALFLVLAFIASAGVWLLLHAEFLAIVLVLVYVGAVMVLFLFVLMMLDINMDRLREGFWRYFPLVAFITVLFAAQIVAVVMHGDFIAAVGDVDPEVANADNTRALGGVLYTDYIYPFELAALLLLVAMVSAVALTLRRRKNTRVNNPATQVQVTSADRVRLVSSLSADSPLMATNTQLTTEEK